MGGTNQKAFCEGYFALQWAYAYSLYIAFQWIDFHEILTMPEKGQDV